ELKQQGGSVLQLVERWTAEKENLSPEDAVRRMNSYYIPKIVEAKLDFKQTQFVAEADRVIKDLKPETGHPAVDTLMKEAKEKGFSLGDLLNPEKLLELDSVTETASMDQDTLLTPSGASLARKVNVLNDPTARPALARYVSMRREERMLRTAFFEPLDTYATVNRQLGNAVVTGRQ